MAKTKMILNHRNGRYRQAYGEVDGGVIREQGRNGGTYSLLGNPIIEDNKPVFLESVDDLLKVKIPFPNTEKQAFIGWHGVLFGMPTDPKAMEKTEDLVLTSKAIYNNAYLSNAAGKAESEAHQLQASGYKVLLLLATILVVIFGIIAISKR